MPGAEEERRRAPGARRCERARSVTPFLRRRLAPRPDSRSGRDRDHGGRSSPLRDCDRDRHTGLSERRQNLPILAASTTARHRRLRPQRQPIRSHTLRPRPRGLSLARLYRQASENDRRSPRHGRGSQAHRPAEAHPPTSAGHAARRLRPRSLDLAGSALAQNAGSARPGAVPSVRAHRLANPRACAHDRGPGRARLQFRCSADETTRLRPRYP